MSKLGDGDASGRKGTLRRSKTEPNLQYLPITQYVSDRIIELGWERSDADPVVSKQVKSPPAITGQKEERLLDYTRTVASMTLNLMLGTPLLELKGVLSGKAFRILRDSTFRCIANAILRIFDKEDFERIREYSKFSDEYEMFASAIDRSLNATTQTLELDKFTTLRESDAFCILKCYEDCNGRNGFQVYPWDYKVTFQPAAICKSDLDLARGVIQNFVPLKRSDRVQLALELLFKTCYHVYDTLALGVLAGIAIDRSADSIRPKADEVPNYESEAAGTLALFMYAVLRGLSWLVNVKSSAQDFFHGAITSHMLSGFRPFDEEVIEVIQFAEFERRVSGFHSINIRHVLLGLSLSRVGTWVKRLLDYEREKGDFGYLEMSLLSILRKSRTLEGSGPATLVDVVLAIFPQQQAHLGEVEEKDAGSNAKVIDDGAWDAKLVELLGLDGHDDTLEDVKMWNFFWNSSEKALELCSHYFVIHQLTKENYTLYKVED